MRNLRNSKGFTLIELMIVVVIIGILAAIAIPKFTSVTKGAKEAEAAPVLKQIRTLQESWKLGTGNGSYSADIATLPGWSDPGSEIYTFSTTATCAIATSSDVTVAAHRSMSLATGDLYATADCTGTAL